MKHACLAIVTIAALAGCARGPADGADAEVTTRGSVEVTARLVEIPTGAIVRRDLYTYATILKYEVVKAHRGKLETNTIYVAHYNPHKSRSTASDRAAKVGGNLTSFLAGQTHRMALEVPLDEHYMGPIVNQYISDPAAKPLYLAVWTNLAE